MHKGTPTLYLIVIFWALPKLPPPPAFFSQVGIFPPNNYPGGEVLHWWNFHVKSFLKILQIINMDWEKNNAGRYISASTDSGSYNSGPTDSIHPSFSPPWRLDALVACVTLATMHFTDPPIYPDTMWTVFETHLLSGSSPCRDDDRHRRDATVLRWGASLLLLPPHLNNTIEYFGFRIIAFAPDGGRAPWQRGPQCGPGWPHHLDAVRPGRLVEQNEPWGNEPKFKWSCQLRSKQV